MKTIFVLIVWFGFGKTLNFDVEKFDSMEECLIVKQTILEQIQDDWFGPKDKDIKCVEVSFKGEL